MTSCKINILDLVKNLAITADEPHWSSCILSCSSLCWGILYCTYASLVVGVDWPLCKLFSRPPSTGPWHRSLAALQTRGASAVLLPTWQSCGNRDPETHPSRHCDITAHKTSRRFPPVKYFKMFKCISNNGLTKMNLNLQWIPLITQTNGMDQCHSYCW